MTKQNIAPRIDADFEQIKSVSSGTIRSSWNAGDGAARQSEIEQARKEAYEEHQAYLKSLEPTQIRLASLEKEVARLSAQLKLLEK